MTPRVRLPRAIRSALSPRAHTRPLTTPGPARAALAQTQIASSSSRSETRLEAAAAYATPSTPNTDYTYRPPASTSTKDAHLSGPLRFATSTRSDDEDLKAHFDRPTHASSSSSASSTSFSHSSPSGLFLYPPVSSPRDLPRLTDRTLIHAQRIVDRINSSKSDPTGRELRLVVKNLDRLSDLLCGVIDMCELIRNVHPEEKWVLESERAYERLCSFMNGLNTDTRLYEVSGCYSQPRLCYHEPLQTAPLTRLRLYWPHCSIPTLHHCPHRKSKLP